jgi:hypothetical protein
LYNDKVTRDLNALNKTAKRYTYPKGHMLIMLEKLKNSTIAWLVLSVIAILGFVLSIVFYLKSIEKKEFSYYLRSTSFISKKEPKFTKLAVTYDGQQIDDFNVSKFIIWNSGNKTINASDMVESKELTITSPVDGIILDSEIIACSDNTNKFSIQQIDDHTIKILFEYVDKQEGVVIQIQHTGLDNILKSGMDNIFKIDCKIKGGKPIKNIESQGRKIIIKILFCFCFLTCIILIFLVFLLEIFLFRRFVGNIPKWALRKASKWAFRLLFSSIIILLIITCIVIFLAPPPSQGIFKEISIIDIPSTLKNYSSFDN